MLPGLHAYSSKADSNVGFINIFVNNTHARIVGMNVSFGREMFSAILKAFLTTVTVVTSIFFSFVLLIGVADTPTAISDGSCNIAVLPIEGTILPFLGIGGFDLITTPDFVSQFMDTAEADTRIKGVVLEINSPGGTPVASERIAQRIADSTLPVVGLIGDVGASGGYMVAAASDFLIASAMSDVGSIGVNMSYVEESKKNEEEGLTYVQLMTGKYKDIGSPNRPITDEERELLQADLDVIHNEFIDIVAEYRELPRGEVVALATGASMPGRRAIEVDLIDAIGGRKQVTAALAGFTDINLADIKFCEYEKNFLPF
ncbi:MAG: protease-4 [Candidatus Paceibacteria bacterium]